MKIWVIHEENTAVMHWDLNPFGCTFKKGIRFWPLTEQSWLHFVLNNSCCVCVKYN